MTSCCSTEALENPPLLVVCDMDRFEVHTNFTGTVKKVHAFSLETLDESVHLEILRKLFTDPQSLKPGETTASVTEQAAEKFSLLADGMRVRGIEPHQAAQFLMKLMFCMFAEDIGLLGRREDKLFTRTLANAKQDPGKLSGVLKLLFQAMSTGGMFGADEIPYFNGGLFQDADVVDLTGKEIRVLGEVNLFDWADVEPSVFGTLFERTLDPAKRSQIGAHYTSREDIETLLVPVMMAPLRREWDEVRQQCDKLFEKVKAESAKARKAGKQQKKDSKPFRDLTKLASGFLDRLSQVTVLDPACGSGNFLYVALHLLLDLEKEVISYLGPLQLGLFPKVRPTQLHGIEINPYAQELAQVVIWIGYLQWMHHNGFAAPSNPVLDPIDTIENKDAILDLSDPEHPREPDWPEAEFIVGNPPFLGGKLLRTNLGDDYVDQMFRVWNERVPRESDLCCYWFERARTEIQLKRCSRAGLLATQGIRGGANRKVLERIKDSGDIFWAIADRDWVLDGATVHVSLIGFDDGRESFRVLNGNEVGEINSSVTSSIDLGIARALRPNFGSSFMGDTKGGAFDIAQELAIAFLNSPNPHGRPNSDVLYPYVNGLDLTKRTRSFWIIDFPHGTSLDAASQYEAPFRHLVVEVRPVRESRGQPYLNGGFTNARE